MKINKMCKKNENILPKLYKLLYNTYYFKIKNIFVKIPTKKYC